MLGDTQWCSPCCCCKVPPPGGVSFGADFTDKCWSSIGATSINPLTFESQLPSWLPGGNQFQFVPPFYSDGGFAVRCLMWPLSPNVKSASLRIRATVMVTMEKGPNWYDGNECRVYATLRGDAFAQSSAGLFANSGYVFRNLWEYKGTDFQGRSDPKNYDIITYEATRYFQTGNFGFQLPAYQFRLYDFPLLSGTTTRYGPTQVIDETFYLEDGWWWFGNKYQMWQANLLAEGSSWGFPSYGIAFENRYNHAKVEVLDFFVDWEYS